MEFSPKPDFSPIMERCLTLSGSAVQINMAMDKVLEKIKADPQSGSCPNLVYNMGANVGGMLGDPSGYAMSQAMNLENLLKLAYANPYAALAQPTPANFAYPGATAAYLAAQNPHGASTGLYQSAALNQAVLDQQTAALWASMGLAAPGGFPTGLGSQANPGQHQQQQNLMPAVSTHPGSTQHNAALAAAAQAQRATALQKEGNPLTALNSNPLLGANLAQQNQILAAAGLLPNGGGNLGSNGSQNAATGHFLADNSSGASSISGVSNTPQSLTSTQEATGVYMASLPTSINTPGFLSSSQNPINSFNSGSANSSLQMLSEQQINQNFAVKNLLQSQQQQQQQNPLSNNFLESSNSAAAGLLNPLNTSALQNVSSINGSVPNNVFRTGNPLDSQHQPCNGLFDPNSQPSINSITTQTLEVEDNIVGAVLGVAGKTLLEIQTASGAKIQVSPKGEPTTELRRLTIVGNHKSVSTACALIEHRIKVTQEIRALQGKVTV